MRNEISNSDDLIDFRDVIARIEELETELDDAHDDADANDVLDLRTELATLNAFAEECKGNGGDEQWRGDWYPITLIRETYFKEYAQELAEDIGAIPKDAAWPCTCIDWEQAARELRMDYTGADFDGITYYVR